MRDRHHQLRWQFGSSATKRWRDDGGAVPGVVEGGEAAEVMGMSARHVRRLVAERQIAFHKLGRSVRIARADIAAYIEASRVVPITASDVCRGMRRVG
jgi:excisionase family DNA binding protein